VSQNTDDFLTENLMSGTADITYGGELSFPGVEGDNTIRVLSWQALEMNRAQFAVQAEVGL